MKIYLNAMEKIFSNILSACAEKCVKHLVFFPFGMGAFLRHLNLVDPWYRNSSEMLELRRNLAARFVEELGSASAHVHVHLCIPFCDEDSEAKSNADAFVRGLEMAPAVVQQKVTVYPGGDSLELAHLLVAGSPSCDVALVNGANRKLVGNHWFEGGARSAIDENLHRRSWSLSAVAYLLNDHGESLHGKVPGCPREQQELENRVSLLGGQVVFRQP